MRQSICNRILSLGTILSLGLLPSCNGNSDTFAAKGIIDPSGGMLTVTSGPLTGTVILIPAGAVDRAIKVEIRKSSSTQLLGFENVGPGTNVSPSGLGLEVDGTATLVFDPALVPAGATAADFVVFRQTSQGRRVDMDPKSVDMVAGTVDVDIDQFASYWVSVQTRDLEFLLPNFFPLLDGDSYTFDNDIVLVVKNTFTEPNLEGLSISKTTFIRDLEGLGFYFTRGFAETFFLGSFAINGAFQEIAFPPFLWLGATGVVGSNFSDRGALSIFVPFSSVFPVDVVELRTSVTIESAGSLSTPLGTFSDVLEVSFFAEREDDLGNVSDTLDILWLARGVGPVQISLEGIADGKGRLTGGIVGGLPIVPR